MATFIAIIHILAALFIVGLVLIQDSKSNGAFGIGGSGSNSLLGATGAQSLASKMTVAFSIVFALTSVGLSYYSASKERSVTDRLETTTSPATATPVENPAPPEQNQENPNSSPTEPIQK